MFAHFNRKSIYNTLTYVTIKNSEAGLDAYINRRERTLPLTH